MKLRKKSVAAVLAVTMALFCIIGGTLAWLTASTEPVQNVFTVGDINLTLGETTTDYKMVPGNDIAKDPVVTVEADSEACWVFVKVEKSSNYDEFMTGYTMASEWTKLTDVDGANVPDVYYRQVSADKNNDQPFQVLAGKDTDAYEDGYVTVRDTVTKEMMEALGSNTANYPKLTFTAYAVQQDNLNVQQAWAEVSGTTTGTGSEPETETN